MEKKIKFLFLLLCCLINSPAIAQQMRDVSRQEALSIVKMCFNDQDVDYYLCDDPVLNVMSEGENSLSCKAMHGYFSLMQNQ